MSNRCDDPSKYCVCGNPQGSNRENCERCELIADRQELLDTLRYLHDFAQILKHSRDEQRSCEAFRAAINLLKKHGA